MQSLIHAGQAGSDGVLLAIIDMPGRSMNVFSGELMDALEALMDRVDGDATVRSVVLTSGKSSFLAGADLVMVQGYTTAARTSTRDQMFDLCGRLGRLFVRLETSLKPWVAAINGLALGGGLELALACRQRLVADDPRLQLGTPEVRWGLLPGAGGTQRLPRMAGFDAAMDLLLSGRSMAPAEAFQLGVVDAVVPSEDLLDRARVASIALQGQAIDWSRKFRNLAQEDVPTNGPAQARSIAEQHGVGAEKFDQYPAFGAIVDSVLLGARLPLEQATAVEMWQFLRLMFSPVAARMIRTLFLERMRAEKELAPPVDIAISGLRVGPMSPERHAWTQALSRTKLTQVTDDTLASDQLVLVDAQGKQHGFNLRVLGETAAVVDGPALVLCPAGPYGRIVEVLGDSIDSLPAAAALAAKLWAIAWPSGETVSFLQRCSGLSLEGQAAIARNWKHAHQDANAVWLDVAACVSGVSPGWSGGPLIWAEDQAKNQ